MCVGDRIVSIAHNSIDMHVAGNRKAIEAALGKKGDGGEFVMTVVRKSPRSGTSSPKEGGWLDPFCAERDKSRMLQRI